MSEKIVVSSESSCDLSKELIDRYSVSILPLNITIGEDTYIDGVNLTARDIFSKVAATGVLPVTAAVSPFAFEQQFRELRKNADRVIHFSISGKISSCYQNACLAAEEVGGVDVIDSCSLSTGIGLLVLAACEMIQEGKSTDKIVARCRELTGKLDVSFILGDLQYMYKGGRCSTVTMFGANLLKLKPIIQLKDGAMGVCGKYRGTMEHCIRQYVEERLANADPDPKRVFVTSTCLDDTYPGLTRSILEEKGIFQEILTTYAGCTVTSHCGKDTLGILFFQK